MLAGVIQFQERLVSAAPGTGGYSSVLALRRSPKRSDRTHMTQVSFSLFFFFSSLLLLMLLCIKQRVTNGQPGQMTVYDSALPTSLLPPACVSPLSRASRAAGVGVGVGVEGARGLSDSASIRSFGGIVYCCSRSRALHAGCGPMCVCVCVGSEC